MKNNVTLGIAIAHATTPPGVIRTLDEIAAFCDCRKSTIHMIETEALKKLRRVASLHRLAREEFNLSNT